MRIWKNGETTSFVFLKYELILSEKYCENSWWLEHFYGNYRKLNYLVPQIPLFAWIIHFQSMHHCYIYQTRSIMVVLGCSSYKSFLNSCGFMRMIKKRIMQMRSCDLGSKVKPDAGKCIFVHHSVTLILTNANTSQKADQDAYWSTTSMMPIWLNI